jgi:hypothetical protein
VGRKPWTTDIPSRIASGTAFPMMSASASNTKLLDFSGETGSAACLWS